MNILVQACADRILRHCRPSLGSELLLNLNIFDRLNRQRRRMRLRTKSGLGDRLDYFYWKAGEIRRDEERYLHAGEDNTM